MAEKQNLAKRPERDHPVLSEDSPLNRQLLRAAGVPDMKSLLVALAHPMSDEDIRMLAQKAGDHKAHHNRIKHLREHAHKAHGAIGQIPSQDEDEGDGTYPDNRNRPSLEEFKKILGGIVEDGGLGRYLYAEKSYSTGGLRKAIDAVSGQKGGIGQIVTGGRGYTQTPEGSLEDTPGLFSRNEPGAELHSPRARGPAGENLHVNGAGLLEIGPGPEPFRAKLRFNQADPHEAAVHRMLSLHGKDLTGEHMAPEDMGNHILFQDLLPDPFNPQKAQGHPDDNAERRAMAQKISSLHGGITPDEAHSVLDRMHRQAQDDFEAYPLHSMDNVMVSKKVRIPVTDPATGKTTFRVETTQEAAIPREDAQGNKIYNLGNRPLSHVAFGRLVRFWNDIPEKQRKETRKWYGTEAHEFIKDLAYAGHTHYLKAAGVLALMNNEMGWETGSSGAAQQVLGHHLGITYKVQNPGQSIDPTSRDPKDELETPEDRRKTKYVLGSETDPEINKYVTEEGLKYLQPEQQARMRAAGLVKPSAEIEALKAKRKKFGLKAGQIARDEELDPTRKLTAKELQEMEGPHKPGSSLEPETKIIRPIYGRVMRGIKDILAAPNEDTAEILTRIRKHLGSEKLGNFFMDMIGAAPWHTNTNDRHQLAIQGLIDPKTGGYAETPANGKDSHRYYWRNMHAAAHMLGVPARELQAATWVRWRQLQGETAQGAGNEDWPKARLAVDAAMRARAQGEGPRAVRRVEHLIKERRKREAKVAAIMSAHWTPEQEADATKARLARKNERRQGNLDAKRAVQDDEEEGLAASFVLSYGGFTRLVKLAKSIQAQFIAEYCPEQECQKQPLTFLLVQKE